MTHWMQTCKTDTQLFLTCFWKLTALMIQEFSDQARTNAESQLEKQKRREERLFHEKNEEIKSLKQRLKILETQVSEEHKKAEQQIRIAREDKDKYFYALIDYEQSWKAMMEKTSNQLRLTETKQTFKELDTFLDLAMEEKAKQLTNLEEINKMFIRGLDFVTSRTSSETQTELSFIQESRPTLAIYPPFQLPDDRDLLRQNCSYKITGIEQVCRINEKRVNFQLKDARKLFQKVLREKTLGIQTLSKQTLQSIGSPGKPRKRSSFLVTISDSEESVVAGTGGSLIIKNPNQTLCQFLLMTLLTEEDDPSRVSQIFSQFVHCLGKQTKQAKARSKFRKKSSTSDYFRQSSDIGASKTHPPYMFQMSLGHPVCLLANRLLGINGERVPYFWEVNFFLQKRADLASFLKIDLQDTSKQLITVVSLIQEEKKEHAEGSGESTQKNSLRISTEMPIQVENSKEKLDSIPDFQNQKKRVKFQQLVSFTEKQLTNDSATLLAANIFHEMEYYNYYISSFEEILVPIEWPRTPSLTSALTQNFDNFECPDPAQVLKSRPQRKITDAFKKTGLDNVYSIQEIDMQLFDRCFIMLLCLQCQMKKKDLDFKQVMQKADTEHKGYVSMWEFKQAMQKSEIILSEEDVIILSRVCSFLNRSTNFIRDPDMRYECSLYIDYAKLVDFLSQSKIRNSYRTYHYHLSIFELALFKSIQKTVLQKKENLKRLFKLKSVESYGEFQLEMKNIYKCISAVSIQRVFLQTVTATAQQRAEAFAEGFYYHVSKEGGFEKGIILNELI